MYQQSEKKFKIINLRKRKRPFQVYFAPLLTLPRDRRRTAGVPAKGFISRLMPTVTEAWHWQMLHVMMLYLLDKYCSLHFAWVVDDTKCIVVTHVCVSVCVCVGVCVCLFVRGCMPTVDRGVETLKVQREVNGQGALCHLRTKLFQASSKVGGDIWARVDTGGWYPPASPHATCSGRSVSYTHLTLSTILRV